MSWVEEGAGMNGTHKLEKRPLVIGVSNAALVPSGRDYPWSVDGKALNPPSNPEESENVTSWRPSQEPGQKHNKNNE